MYKQDPKSARSRRRANRMKVKPNGNIEILRFKGSRPVRRATKELEARQKDYSEKHATDNSFTKPGAINHW